MPMTSFVWPSIHAKRVSLFQAWGRVKFEGKGAPPSRTFAAGCRWALWGDVTLWVSSWQLLPWLWHWGSRQGLLVRHRETELKAAFHHSGGKRKGQEMYLSAFVVWKWHEFFGEKKKIFSFRPEIWPSQKIQAAFWAWRRTVRGVIAVQCLNPHSFAVFFLYCALCNFCGRTWSWDNDNTVSLENASAFYCL